jgi:hypothetical protein
MGRVKGRGIFCLAGWLRLVGLMWWLGRVQWLAQEGESVVSLRCTPAYGSEVGVCDAGFVGMAEAMPFRPGSPEARGGE